MKLQRGSRGGGRFQTREGEADGRACLRDRDRLGREVSGRDVDQPCRRSARVGEFVLRVRRVVLQEPVFDQVIGRPKNLSPGSETRKDRDWVAGLHYFKRANDGIDNHLVKALLCGRVRYSYGK